MTGYDPSADPDAGDPALAELTEEVTRLLQSGRPIPDHDLEPCPFRARSLEGLLPVLRELTDLGRLLARQRSRNSRQPSFKDPGAESTAAPL